MTSPILRGIVLALASLMAFGVYYAYDIPAATNTLFEKYMSTSTTDFQYSFNLLYSLYSFPNIIFPFIGGYLLDKFNKRKLMLFYAFLVLLGQFFFSIGVSSKSWMWMYFGRVLFGVGGESLAVAQTTITTKYLAPNIGFALGINISIGRLGSVLNDLVSPYLAVHSSVESAVWMGFVMCVGSFICCLGLAFVDSKYGQSHQFERVDTEENISDGGIENNENRFSEEVEMRSYDANEFDDELLSKKDHEFRRFNNYGNLGIFGIVVRFLNQFSIQFWLLCAVIILLYATVIPFNTIHSAFLQSKWFHDDPQRAAQIVAIPDTLAALLVPVCGIIIDIFGHRTKLIILCGTLIFVVHYLLGFSDPKVITNPIWILCGLGVAYSMLGAVWSCIPVVVEKKLVSTAFGIATSAFNSSLFIFPIIIASLINADPTYTKSEIFFMGCALVGVFVGILLYSVDKLDGGRLDKEKSRIGKSTAVHGLH